MFTAHSGAASVSADSQFPNSNNAGRKLPRGADTAVASRLPEMATIEMAQRLPKLDDDDDIGVEKEHVVSDDDARDLRFHGTLLASAAPEFNGRERWREYRVYRTASGNYVFSKVGRSLLPDERDKFEAHVWRPEDPGDLPVFEGSELTSYRDKLLADALAEVFKFDPLAKQLYAKLKVDTARRID